MKRTATVIPLPIGQGAQTGHQTVASMLADRIKADIIRGDLKPGQKLKIADISALYGVGSIPLREALSRLANSGFVDSRDQRGFNVREVSAAELLDITRVRILVESAALRESIENGSYDWESRVVGALHSVSRLAIFSDTTQRKLDAQWEAAHDELHRQLLSGCDSPWLIKFAGELRDQTTRYRHISAAAQATVSRDVMGEHNAIVDAAISRKAELAVALLCDHIATSASVAVGEFGPEAIGEQSKLRGRLPKLTNDLAHLKNSR